MPYRSNEDLPAPVRHSLPAHAQDIYHEAFNHSLASDSGDVRQEESLGSDEAALRQGRRQLGTCASCVATAASALSTDATAMKVTVHDFRSIVARGLSDQSEAADQHIDRHREYERRKYSVQCAFSAGERVGRAGAD